MRVRQKHKLIRLFQAEVFVSERVIRTALAVDNWVCHIFIITIIFVLDNNFLGGFSYVSAYFFQVLAICATITYKKIIY